MDKFSILCTEEQTKKALELGAPIELLPNYTEFQNFPYVKCNDGNERPCIIPTAEQMIGWLEEQGIWEISVYKNIWTYSWTVLPLKGERLNGHDFKSRKEATIAAIDAALDYLIKAKED